MTDLRYRQRNWPVSCVCYLPKVINVKDLNIDYFICCCHYCGFLCIYQHAYFLSPYTLFTMSPSSMIVVAMRMRTMSSAYLKLLILLQLIHSHPANPWLPWSASPIITSENRLNRGDRLPWRTPWLTLNHSDTIYTSSSDVSFWPLYIFLLISQLGVMGILCPACKSEPLMTHWVKCFVKIYELEVQSRVEYR